MRIAHVVSVALAGLLANSAGVLAQTSAPTSASFAPFEGSFQLPSGDQILVARVGVTDELARPYFLDWQTGRYGYLRASGADTFSSAASLSAGPDAPAQTEIAFSRGASGLIDGLMIREKGTPERRAIRIEPYNDRAVAFNNGEVTLAATVRTPKTTGRVPGVVLVHGSGPGTRTQVSLMNAFFAGHGLAVLSYDKRGCGSSGGDWKTVDLDVLAQDALAGVRWLKAQPGIDASRVGVWGISQGGWITPLAGSIDPGVAFVINMSGPATSLRRQDTFMMTNTLTAGGYDPDEIALALKGLNLLYDYGQGRASAEALDAMMDQARAHPKLKELALPPAAQISREAMYAKQKIGDPAWYFHLNPDNDALTPYRKLRCPVLVTYGRLDYTVPVEESVRLLAEIAAEPGRRNLTVEVIPDSGHGYLRMQETQPMNPEVPTTISRAYFDVVEKWLASHVSGRPRR